MNKLIVLALLAGVCAYSESVFTTRLDDPAAVYLEAPTNGADATDALQSAIDRAEHHAREGIVFVAPGRYSITRTVFVWPGVRLFGYGATRPVFVLPPNTAGFQHDEGVMVMFTGARPGEFRGMRVPFPPPGSVPPNANIADANSGTFYSAMSNIDFEVGAANPAAVCIRFHVAQHAYLAHMDFHVGDGLAALTQIGNEAEDLHFFGGRYGILTEKTSPAWQFTLLDSTFEGQKEAAIREHEAALTLAHDEFRNVPVAIDIHQGYPDQLWIKDCRFDHVSKTALIISLEKSALTEIGIQNATMRDAHTLAQYRESGKTVGDPAASWTVSEFVHGLIVPSGATTGEIGDRLVKGGAERREVRAIRPLPATGEWVNVHTLGVAGDGKTDDTAALQAAIDSHRVLYLPSGHYLVHDTLRLRPDTVLIGLHPTLTQIDLADDTPGFAGVGAPKPVLLAPKGGSNILSGFGVFTGGVNPRAAGVIWMAGQDSLMDDVRFLGGHGSGTNPYNNNHTADPDIKKRWDAQYPSLWIMNGGGGTFADIWTPDTFAQAGFYVSDTTTPGHVYELSNEHHVRNEIKLERVENWDVNAPQTEEEAGESPDALSLELDSCKNITVANYHAYRVTRSRAPFPSAVRIYNSSNIHFRNVLVNAESGFSTCDANGCGTFLRVSKYPYENAIQDMTHHTEMRERTFAALDFEGTPHKAEAGKSVRKLEGGFFSISGAAADANGKLYFVDHHEQRIYGWSEGQGLTIERDNPLDPVNLAFDRAGDLMVLSSAGPESTVYWFRPGSAESELSVLEPQQAGEHTAARVALPMNYWNNGEFKDQLDFQTMRYKTLAEMFAEDVTQPKTRVYVSPDGSLMIPAGRVFQQGPAASPEGWRFSDNLDTYGFINAAVGERVYVSSESEDITYSAVVQVDGTLRDLKPFAQRGGESVVNDTAGNVYVANGEIFVYGSDGRFKQKIDVPERPIDLVIGGARHNRLFILTQHSLYATDL